MRNIETVNQNQLDDLTWLVCENLRPNDNTGEVI